MKFLFLAPWRFSKKGPWEHLALDYLGRLQRSTQAQWVFPDSALTSDQAASQFLLREVEKLPRSAALWCLDERGKAFSSDSFAEKIAQTESQGYSFGAFIVGGAYGLPASLASVSRPIIPISLSSMTLPHEMAFVVLLEQVYRSQCILAHHPYHHGEPSEFVRAGKKN